MLEILRHKLLSEGTVDIVVRVRPHAARTQLQRILEDGSIKIDIAAPAEDSRGNTALVRFLAEQFSVPASNVKILSGKTARLKLIRIISDQV